MAKAELQTLYDLNQPLENTESNIESFITSNEYNISDSEIDLRNYENFKEHIHGKIKEQNKEGYTHNYFNDSSEIESRVIYRDRVEFDDSQDKLNRSFYSMYNNLKEITLNRNSCVKDAYIKYENNKREIYIYVGIWGTEILEKYKDSNTVNTYKISRGIINGRYVYPLLGIHKDKLQLKLRINLGGTS